MSSFHFISGLPRSGSTLLAALLQQNPAMRAGITSRAGESWQLAVATALDGDRGGTEAGEPRER